MVFANEAVMRHQSSPLLKSRCTGESFCPTLQKRFGAVTDSVFPMFGRRTAASR